MSNKKMNMLTKSALFAALIYAATLTGAVAPIGGGAYIHIGDAMIYFAVVFLPAPYAVAAAAVGAAFADLTLGSMIYVIPTVIVKTLVVLSAKLLMRASKKILVQDILICLSGIVTVAGYYVSEVVLLIISGSQLSAALTTAAVDSVPFNIIQASASAFLFLIAGEAVRNIVDKRKNRRSDDEENAENDAEQ